MIQQRMREIKHTWSNSECRITALNFLCSSEHNACVQRNWGHISVCFVITFMFCVQLGIEYIFCSRSISNLLRFNFFYSKFIAYTGLFEMTVRVLTTYYTQYTSDSSICIFLFNRTTLPVFVAYLTGALYVHRLWFYRVIRNDCQGLNNLSYTIHFR